MAEKYKTPSEPEMKSAIEVARLIMVDIDNNNNKWWNGYVLANGDFYCEYGRVQDAKGDCRHDYYDFGSTGSSSDHLRKKVSEKKRKGYVEQRIVEGPEVKSSGRVASVSTNSLKSIATQQIQGDPEVKKLVAWLAEVNVHQITACSQIKFNVESGMFTTPLGTLVTPDAIVDARTLLNDMANYVVKRQWENSAFKRQLGDYLQLIPQDVGRTRGWHETFLAASDSLQKQNDLLDALDASLTKASTTVAKPDKADKAVQQVFNVALDAIPSGSPDFTRIKNKYETTKGGHRDVSGYKPVAAWTVNITTVHDAFVQHGKPLGNIMELWHGTKASNLLSILKGGLVIPPSSSSHVCGRMFSDGLYFSDQSTKSIRYATGAWGYGGAISRIFMFLADVAMGKYFVPSGSTSHKPPAGYHSYFAQPGKSGIMNNEMVVPNTHQANLTYLIEFKG